MRLAVPARGWDGACRLTGDALDGAGIGLPVAVPCRDAGGTGPAGAPGRTGAATGKETMTAVGAIGALPCQGGIGAEPGWTGEADDPVRTGPSVVGLDGGPTTTGAVMGGAVTNTGGSTTAPGGMTGTGSRPLPVEGPGRLSGGVLTGTGGRLTPGAGETITGGTVTVVGGVTAVPGTATVTAAVLTLPVPRLRVPPAVTIGDDPPAETVVVPAGSALVAAVETVPTGVAAFRESAATLEVMVVSRRAVGVVTLAVMPGPGVV